jgi:hypothetical protein
MTGLHPVLALLGDRGHDGAPAAVVHLSFSPSPSFVGIHRPGRDLTPLVSFLPLPPTGSGALEAVAGIDDSAERLVARFRAAFPDTVARLEQVGFGTSPTPALSWLLNLCALLLDLDEDDVRRALNEVEETVRVDTPVIPEGDGFMLDGRRLLRSVMSYRVAGVPRHVLAASVFTSLGEFAGQAVRRLVRAWPAAEVVACAGDLFAGNVLLREQTRRSLTGLRRPVLLPSIPADGQSP